jgi:hypothetical protein
LVEATDKGKGHDCLGNEDRLSQIFSATFNNSRIFQKLFLKFIKLPFKKLHFICETQNHYPGMAKDSRTDIEIFIQAQYTKKHFILVENKVAAHLYTDQLKQYNAVKELLPCKRRIALTRENYEPKPFEGWINKTWGDFYAFLMKFRPNIINHKTDLFIIDNFLEYLEENDMEKITKISRNEVCLLSKFLFNARYEKIPAMQVLNISEKNIFTIASHVYSIFDDIGRDTSNMEIIVKRTRTKIRPHPHLGYEEDNKQSERKLLWLGLIIELPKDYKNIHFLCSGIVFNNNKKGTYRITIGKYDKFWKILGKTLYNDKGIKLETLKSQTINTWVKWLK